MKAIPILFAALALAAVRAGGADGSPADRAPVRLLLEVRGEAEAMAAYERLGIPVVVGFGPEQRDFRDFSVSRNLAYFAYGTFPGHLADIRTLSPEDRDAFLALYADGNWTGGPETPEGFRTFSAPSGAFTDYVAEVGGKWVASSDPGVLREALALLPSLPVTLPAEGVLACRVSGADLASTANSRNAARVRENLATLTAGLGLDGDTAAFHALAESLPGSGMASALGACGPVPAAAACVNLHGAFGFYVQGAGSPVMRGKEAAHGFAVAVYPPVGPARMPTPRVLAYIGDPGGEEQARTRRETAAALHTESTTYRGIPVDEVPAASAAVLMRAAACACGVPEDAAALMPGASVRFAWLPAGDLMAVNDEGGALLHAAIDAALDGTAIPFAAPPAFPAADGPVPALAHLDLAVLAPMLPVQLPFAVPAPCPVDLMARVLPGGTMEVRLRAPADFVRNLAAALQASLAPSKDGGHTLNLCIPIECQPAEPLPAPAAP
ncbi:MAG: hypothetical protein IKQ55_09750 [Kiritimatiellae bacterium]|nr:hypothetical protein [Kiritimatiellia bacterium]